MVSGRRDLQCVCWTFGDLMLHTDHVSALSHASSTEYLQHGVLLIGLSHGTDGIVLSSPAHSLLLPKGISISSLP